MVGTSSYHGWRFPRWTGWRVGNVSGPGAALCTVCNRSGFTERDSTVRVALEPWTGSWTGRSEQQVHSVHCVRSAVFSDTDNVNPAIEANNEPAGDNILCGTATYHIEEMGLYDPSGATQPYIRVDRRRLSSGQCDPTDNTLWSLTDGWSGYKNYLPRSKKYRAVYLPNSQNHCDSTGKGYTYKVELRNASISAVPDPGRIKSLARATLPIGYGAATRSSPTARRSFTPTDAHSTRAQQSAEPGRGASRVRVAQHRVLVHG